MKLFILLSTLFVGGFSSAECVMDSDALMKYEQEILNAASKKKYVDIAEPLTCLLRMQNETEGFAKYLSSSFLRPLFGADLPAHLPKTSEYAEVEKVLTQLAQQSNDVLRNSFVSEFSKGDWSFYTLFCEEGNTSYCSDFLPDAQRVKGEPPLLAAASMLRLRKAYTVLKGSQQDLIASRLKKLYREIPKEDVLRRKFIDQIYEDLFENQIPMT